MLLEILFLILGLAMILVGANMLTDGASAVAKRWGVSDLIIGLTVVAFGTSAPELVISVMSAIEGSTGIAIGNIVGSNIFNILAIIGVTALVRPIAVEKGILVNDIPLVILSSVALLAMGSSSVLDPGSQRILNRVDGILLLLFFCIFMRYTFASARKADGPDPAADSGAAIKAMPAWKSAVWIIAGLVGLIFGGDLFVSGASDLARRMGVSDAIIGLTIVAAGTSLPELATSVTAAVKGKPGIAIGNVIGSNIFNIFMVLGVAGTIRELPFGGIGITDLLILTVASLLFWIFGWFFRKRTITRAEGAVLAAGYMAYIAYTILR